MKNLYRISSLTAAALLIMAGLPIQAAGKSEKSAHILVALRGTDIGTLRVMDDGASGDESTALCFDLDIIDLKTGRKIGTASDCLSNIEEVNGGLALVGRTIFNFPGGKLVTRGLTSVQPTTRGSLDFTNITGAIPAAGENSVLSGTGRFKNASGSARLSGAVKIVPIANGPGKEDDQLQMTFDCVFDHDLSVND